MHCGPPAWGEYQCRERAGERLDIYNQAARKTRQVGGHIVDEVPQKTVLMADDDAEDCWLATEAFAETGAKAALSCVMDGAQLMSYLKEHSRSEANRLPDLILLDLNMPGKDGREAHIEIKSDPDLQHIPIVILTTSEEPEDADLTLKAGAELFITKPATFSEWVEMMKSLAEHWINTLLE